ISNTIAAVATATQGGMAQRIEALGPGLPAAALVYPNPARDYLGISVTAQHMQVRIMNITGAEVMQVKMQEGNDRVDVSQLPKGIYTIELYDGQKKQYERFVKE
ncbi:MAG: T9SS type A sorting domain-containing protein, partial [Pontibacter sp.]|nr:T9SS type A sorting domain-containing protein [Pontibacter sp.]